MRLMTYINKKFISLIFICLAGVFYLGSAHAQPLQKSATPKEFLINQETVRILANGGIGFGDLASSANVMIHLRQIGFEGTFEIIYSGKSTVISMFDLPSSLPNVYEDTKNKRRFIYVGEYLKQAQANATTPVTFGAGSMFPINACDEILNEDENNELAKKMRETSLCRNPANFLNAKIYFDIANWPSPSKNYDEELSSHYFLLNNDNTYPYDDSKTFFATRTTNLEDAEAYLNNDKRGQDLLLKKPALKTYIDGIKKKDFDVMSVYGWGIKSNVVGGSDNINYVRNMIEVISGARYAQLYGPEALRSKPLIITVFYDYEKESSELRQLIQSNDWGKYEQPGSEQARKTIAQMKLADIFSIASISDPKTIATIQQLKPGQILLLSMGPLPKDVFDGLYTYVDENVWPQIREGSGSFSSLIFTGKPHFRCGGELIGNQGGLWEMDLDAIQDTTLKNKLKNFYSVSNGFCESQNYTWQENGDFYKAMGDLMIDAHDPRSAFSQYFQSIQNDALKPENDRVYRALEKTIEILNSQVH